MGVLQEPITCHRSITRAALAGTAQGTPTRQPQSQRHLAEPSRRLPPVKRLSNRTVKQDFSGRAGLVSAVFSVSSFTGGFVFQPRNPSKAWSPTASSRAALVVLFGLGFFYFF